MKRLFSLSLATLLAISSTGCANMTPEQQAALGGALLGGLAVAGAVAASRPVYVAPQPVYVAPVHTTCRNFYGTVHCNSW